MPSDRDRPDEDLDAAFAAIIAGWDDIPSLDEPVADQPVDEVPHQSADRPRPVTDDHYGRRAGDEAPTPPPDGPRDWSPAEDEDDDRYHPPEPPPLPRGDLVGRLAWGGVLLGPAFLLFAGVAWRDAPRLWLALAVLGFVGGFVTLVLRLPADRDDTDGDDGAVV